jgi:hypothetical protein
LRRRNGLIAAISHAGAGKRKYPANFGTDLRLSRSDDIELIAGSQNVLGDPLGGLYQLTEVRRAADAQIEPGAFVSAVGVDVPAHDDDAQEALGARVVDVAATASPIDRRTDAAHPLIAGAVAGRPPARLVQGSEDAAGSPGR